jgi:hypothetical protein
LIQIHHGPHIHATHKGTIPASSENDDTNFWLRTPSHNSPGQLPDQFVSEGVQGLRPINGNGYEGSFLVEKKHMKTP